MAHIPDGLLSAPVLIAGAVVSSALLYISLRKLEMDRIPQVAVLTAAFFITSLVSIPVGPGSAHLLLSGLMGVVLGWAVVPAVLVALILQALFFGYGGVLVLGVNLMNIALPALICGGLFARWLGQGSVAKPFLLGAMAGGLGVMLTGLMVMLTVALSSPDYLPAAKVVMLVYLPLMAVEALVSGTVIGFIRRVAPEMLSIKGLSGSG
jgi:cobalt/nickel transport system permease protein